MAMQTYKTLIGSLLLMICNLPATADSFGKSSFSLEGPEILAVDEAFRLTAAKTEQGVLLYWQIMPGYYLYKHRLKVKADGMEGELPLSMGKGKTRTDEYFGQVEVFYEELEVAVHPTDTDLMLHVEYQGCADLGICYPPQKRSISP